MNHPTEAQLLAYGRKFFSWRTTACICKCLRAPELLSDRRLASVLLRMIAAMAPMPENPLQSDHDSLRYPMQTRTETRDELQEIFERIDADRNGRIDFDELRAWLWPDLRLRERP